MGRLGGKSPLLSSMSAITARRRLGILVARFTPWAVPLVEFVYVRCVRRACLAVFQWIWRAIPVSSELLGPPKGVVVSAKDWVERDGTRGGMLRPTKDGDLPLMELHEARVCTASGAIIGRDDRLIGEVTPRDTWFDCTQHEVLLRLRLPPIQRKAKRVVCLYTHPALAHNYGHWLFECVSKFGYVQKAFGWERFDRIVVNQIAHPFQAESLRLAGIPGERTVELHERLHLKAESLMASSYIAYATNQTPKWVCDMVRQLIVPETNRSQPTRKIYLTRKHANRRKLLNEEELLRVLERQGFEEVVPEKLSVSEQAALFHESKWVVGLYGAALCNVVFCQPGSVLVELNVNLVPNSGYYGELARTCGVQYECVETTPTNRTLGRGAYYANVCVDVEELEQRLAALAG